MEVLGGEKNYGELSIVVEAKTFTCSYVNGEISLKEIHRKGERELKLSLNQANWISMGMLQRSREFGSSRRRESQAIDGMFVYLIEGSNKRGCFLSIQTKQGKMQSSFVVVPAGKIGQQWWKLAKLIADVVLRREGSDHAAVQGPIESTGSSKERSYAQVVAGTNGGNPVKLAYSHGVAIEERIKSIEVELLELRSLLKKIFGSSSENLEKKDQSREILSHPTVCFEAQKHVAETSTVTKSVADKVADRMDLEINLVAVTKPTITETGIVGDSTAGIKELNEISTLVVEPAGMTQTCTRCQCNRGMVREEITSTAVMSDSEASKAGVFALTHMGSVVSSGTVAENTEEPSHATGTCGTDDDLIEHLTAGEETESEQSDEREELNAIAGERSGDEYLTEAQKELTKDRTSPEKLGGNHVAIMQVDPTALRSGNLGVSAHTVEIEAINAPEQAVNALTYGDQATTGIVGNRVDDDLTAEIEPNPTVEINDSFSVAVGALDAEILAENVAERMADPNIESVIWDDIEGAFVHLASGLRYWPKRDTYFSYVSHKEGKERGVFYNLVDGVPVLCQEGILGESNEITFEEQDWDRNAIFTEESEGYHPDLENFFRARIDRGKNEN